MIKLLLILFLIPTAHAHPMKVTNTTLTNMIDCESSGNSKAVGKHGEYGILQFKYKTFLFLQKKAGPPYTTYKWKNPIHQIKLATWAWEHEYEYWWTCANKLYPSPPMDSNK